MMIMSDAPSTLPTSLLFFTLSLIPSNILRYAALGVTIISLVFFSIYRDPPSARLNRVNDVITVVDTILTQAKAKCMRDHLLLAECETRLLRAKLSASQIHSHLLEIDTMSWKYYLQNRMSISSGLAMCKRELRNVQTSLLLLIESARQRKLVEDIKLGDRR
ncbi:hypothetical protein C8R45DRAFT_1100870 [Mycena sanguinolenta]|nr:hypothetical protein C8R45DRAFT_1100870 [Mycena sanguinolenta]